MDKVCVKSSKWMMRLPIVLVGLVLVVLLLRPHGDTFTALDHSGYRMMSVAFSEGRGLHEEDFVLMEAPQEVRNAFLLFPHLKYRNTRDRSFLVHSFAMGDTEPFFYPLMPALAAAMERGLPGYGRDLTLPLFGLLFCGVLLAMGYRAGCLLGLFTALVFCIGSPLPIWLFRGFYVEAAAGAIFALAVGLWMRRSDAVVVPAFLAGFSAAVHPVFLVLGPPTAILMMMTPQLGRKQAVFACVALIFGLLPLVIMTEWMAAPYGSLTMSHLVANLRVSVPHQLVFGGLLLSVVLWMLSISAPSLREKLCNKMRAPGWRVLVTGCALLPLGLALVLWDKSAVVQRGLYEFWLAIRWPMGILLLIGVWRLHCRQSSLKSFGLWALFLGCLPLFVYLKGTEQMGMWSQRRLFPAYTLLALALIPVCAGWWMQLAHRFPRKIMLPLILGFLSVCSLSNLLRWPAPYLLRVEQGALAEMESIRDQMGDRLVLFDYLPYSFPFAVDNRTRALGLSEHAGPYMEGIFKWLSTRAAEEEILLVTAYASPGLEAGVVLQAGPAFSFDVDRIRSKAALPALKRVSTIAMQFLALNIDGLGSPDLQVDKILDHGPLALRGPWAGTKRSLTWEGERVPADWSRQGSGIVGPLPLPGGQVKIELWAKSGQDVPQTLHLQAPWAAEAVELLIPVEPSKIEFILPVNEASASEAATGVYILSSPSAYDPAQEGIRGFPTDLGALIHRIRISRVTVTEPIGN